MRIINVVESPMDFELRCEKVWIFGGVFKIDGNYTLNLNTEKDIIAEVDLKEFNVDYTDFNHMLCSRNLRKLNILEI